MGAEGVLWGQVSSPTLTRYHGNGSGNTLYSPASQAVATTYFSGLSPWGLMGRVSMLPDGTVHSRCNINTTTLQGAGDNCYLDTDDTGGEQKMVYVPQFCYYCDYVAAHNIVWWVGQVGDSFTLQASDGTFTGSTYTFSSSDIHPAFTVDGVAKSAAYISAYMGYKNTNYLGGGTTVLESIAGQAAYIGTGTTAKATVRGYAEAIGAGWELMTIQAFSALEYLIIIEYASFRSQATDGLSYYSGASAPAATGSTTATGNASVRGTSTKPPTFRGVEGIYSYYFYFLEGYRTQVTTGEIWIAPQSNARTYQDTSFATPYVDKSATALSGTNVRITAIYTTTALNWAFIGSAASGGSSTTYFCDEAYVYLTSTENIVGGSLFNSSQYTLFSGANTGGGTQSSNVGARIQFFPL